MSVSSHLGITIDEYDRMIRTFIPRYEEMLDATAEAIDLGTRVIIDVGVGTGALAARCVARAPEARIVGIDSDPEMLAMARRRLSARATLTRGNFLRTHLPRADAMVASFALHHVRTRRAKLRFYERARRTLRPGGTIVSADCHPDAVAAAAASQREAWLTHLRRTYGRKAVSILDSWADEDVYQPLNVELALMTRAGFRVNVLWRRDGFAVIQGRRP
jgi:ubiquinone/menaquinone biosynthesis C-methylase UbiE